MAAFHERNLKKNNQQVDMKISLSLCESAFCWQGKKRMLWICASPAAWALKFSPVPSSRGTTLLLFHYLYRFRNFLYFFLIPPIILLYLSSFFCGCFSIISFNTCDLLSRVPITFFTFYFSVFFPASSLFVYFTSKGGLWQLLMLLKPFFFFKVLFPSIFFLFFTHWRHIPNFKRLKVNS